MWVERTEKYKRDSCGKPDVRAIRFAVTEIIVRAHFSLGKFRVAVNHRASSLAETLRWDNANAMRTAAQRGEKVDMLRLAEVSGKDGATMRRYLHRCRVIRSLNKDPCRNVPGKLVY